MKRFIVVDSNSRWLFEGEAKDHIEALLYAKESGYYDYDANIYVYEVKNMKKFSSYDHATLKPEDIRKNKRL